MAKDLRGVQLFFRNTYSTSCSSLVTLVVIVPLAVCELKEAQAGAVCSLRSVSFLCFVNGHTRKI